MTVLACCATALSNMVIFVEVLQCKKDKEKAGLMLVAGFWEMLIFSM